MLVLNAHNRRLLGGSRNVKIHLDRMLCKALGRGGNLVFEVAHDPRTIEGGRNIQMKRVIGQALKASRLDPRLEVLFVYLRSKVV